MITRVLEIFKKDNTKAELVITYQIESVDNNVLVKKRVSAYHSQYPETRYRGNPPIIFIRLDDVNDFEFLESVNRLRLFIDNNENNIVVEEDILDILKLHLSKNRYIINKITFSGNEGYVALRRPYASFRPFTNKMFTDAAENIVENAMNGVVKNE